MCRVAWILLVPIVGLTAACASTESDRHVLVRAPVVYGTDDRTEVYAHSSTVLRAVAESAIAVEMSASAIDESDPLDVQVTYSRTLGEAKTLCAGERFADQIEPGTCSGTLLDAQHLLTAAHCVDEARDCDGSRVWLFGFRYEAAGRLAPIDADDVYRCRRVIAARDDAEADHAVVELDRVVIGHTPPLVRPVTSLAPGTELVLIGHPNGIPMKIASGGFVTRSGVDWLEATLDAFSGNSGSGVFDTDGALVAILDSGETDYVARGDCNVVSVIDPPPTDDGEGLTYVRPALEAFCVVPGIDSPVCDCDGPCVEAPAGDRCSDAETLAPVSQTIDTTLVGYAPDVSGSCGGDGPDRVYAFTLASSARFVATTGGFDTVLHLRAGCDGEELACNDDVSDADRTSRIEADLEPGTYVLFVDAYDADVDAAVLVLTIEPPDAPDGGPPIGDDDASVPVVPDAGEPTTDAGDTTRDAAAPVDAGTGITDATLGGDDARRDVPGARADAGGCSCRASPAAHRAKPTDVGLGGLVLVALWVSAARHRGRRAGAR